MLAPTIETKPPQDPQEALLLAGVTEFAEHSQAIFRQPHGSSDQLSTYVKGVLANEVEASLAERLAIFTVAKAEHYGRYDETLEKELPAFLQAIDHTTQDRLPPRRGGASDHGSYLYMDWARQQGFHARKWQIRHNALHVPDDATIKDAERTLELDYEGVPQSVDVFKSATYYWLAYRLRYAQSIVGELDEAIHSPAEYRTFAFRHTQVFAKLLFEQAGEIQEELRIQPTNTTDTPPEVMKRVAAVEKAKARLVGELERAGLLPPPEVPAAKP